MNDKELESMIYNYFDKEVPEPNQKILEELKTKMHERKTSPTKRFNIKFRLALVSCVLVLLIIPAVALPLALNNTTPSTPTAPSTPLTPTTPPIEEEIYYSDSKLTMADLTSDELNSILSGDFSKYATLIEDYTINFARGYYSETNTLVYLKLDMDKNDIPYTKTELNIVFVKNYEHEYNDLFKNVNEYVQNENCNLYEFEKTMEYKKEYYKFFEFEDYKIYLLLDKQDSSIVNAIVQN